MISLLESKVFLCDFHREKAWLEWISKSDNGVSGNKDEVLCLLRSIANSRTLKEFEKAVAAMKKSNTGNHPRNFRNGRKGNGCQVQK